MVLFGQQKNLCKKEHKMEFTQLEIIRNDNGHICLIQDDPYGEPQKVFITADMVDLICQELQKLKK